MAESIACWTADLHSPGSSSTVLPPLTRGVHDLRDISLLPPCMNTSPMVDLVLCINMIHISPFQSTRELFQTSQAVLRPGGLVFLYGPYREGDEDGDSTGMCTSNEAFDSSLRARDPSWGIRSLGEVRGVAAEEGLCLVDRIEMPANNLSVIFKKGEGGGVDEWRDSRSGMP
jgi:hypothetical protein